MGTGLYFLDDHSIGQFDFHADNRCYFLDDHIIGRFDFEADCDDRAVEIAEILFDACSDRCRSWQIWEWGVFLVSGPRKLGARRRASNLSERRQEGIAQCEETIVNSQWPVASSERLFAQLDKLKMRAKRGRPAISYRPEGTIVVSVHMGEGVSISAHASKNTPMMRTRFFFAS